MDDSVVTIAAPDFSHETQAYDLGRLCVAGVDEAGRGPLAGPVVVAAVVLNPDRLPEGLNDSKKLSAPRREELFSQIILMADVSICVAPPVIIDRLNIRGATLWGMRQAVMGLMRCPDHVLVDGRDVPPGLSMDARALIGGDGRSISIAAASIVAKVMRDRMCPVMDLDSPGFSFATHKGYGTAAHSLALQNLGPCLHHRRSFGPVAQANLFTAN